LPFKKTFDDIFQGHQKQQTDTINRKLFENASSPVFAFFSKIIRFCFIGMFPDFLNTLYNILLIMENATPRYDDNLKEIQLQLLYKVSSKYAISGSRSESFCAKPRE
jgi:hypothetical protein